MSATSSTPFSAGSAPATSSGRCLSAGRPPLQPLENPFQRPGTHVTVTLPGQRVRRIVLALPVEKGDGRMCSDSLAEIGRPPVHLRDGTAFAAPAFSESPWLVNRARRAADATGAREPLPHRHPERWRLTEREGGQHLRQPQMTRLPLPRGSDAGRTLRAPGRGTRRPMPPQWLDSTPANAPNCPASPDSSPFGSRRTQCPSTPP